MDIDVLGWAPTREAAAAFFLAAGIASTDSETGAFVPIAECHIDDTVVCQKPTGDMVEDVDGNEYPEMAVVPGLHFNIRFYGASADTLTAGLAQWNEDGTWRPLFERSRILQLVTARTGKQPVWDKVTIDGIPAGYAMNAPKEDYDGVRCFDPQAVANQQRVFA